MELRWIRTFVTAADFENFRQAAEQLYVTQPAVTKHIQRLEECLNVHLFERIGKSVSLTEAGYRFLPEARRLLTAYEKGLEQFNAWKQGYERKLIIAVAPQIAATILPTILRRFIAEYPSIDVYINVVNSYKIGEEVRTGRADIGLSRLEPIVRAVNWQVVQEEVVLLIGPPTATGLDEKTALTTHTLITHNHPHYWDELLMDVHRNYAEVREMNVNQIEITKRFIEEGLGVSYLPYSTVQEELRSGKLVQIECEAVIPPTSATYFVTKIETKESQQFEAFFLQQMNKEE